MYDLASITDQVKQRHPDLVAAGWTEQDFSIVEAHFAGRVIMLKTLGRGARLVNVIHPPRQRPVFQAATLYNTLDSVDAADVLGFEMPKTTQVTTAVMDAVYGIRVTHSTEPVKANQE